jgi:hypothetical protein
MMVMVLGAISAGEVMEFEVEKDLVSSSAAQ